MLLGTLEGSVDGDDAAIWVGALEGHPDASDDDVSWLGVFDGHPVTAGVVLVVESLPVGAALGPLKEEEDVVRIAVGAALGD